jgi:hypothetical protein
MKLRNKTVEAHPGTLSKGAGFLQDDVRAYYPTKTECNPFKITDYPAYFSDLAPPDYYRSSKFKIVLKD